MKEQNLLKEICTHIWTCSSQEINLTQFYKSPYNSHYTRWLFKNNERDFSDTLDALPEVTILTEVDLVPISASCLWHIPLHCFWYFSWVQGSKCVIYISPPSIHSCTLHLSTFYIFACLTSPLPSNHPIHPTFICPQPIYPSYIISHLVIYSPFPSISLIQPSLYPPMSLSWSNPDPRLLICCGRMHL